MKDARETIADIIIDNVLTLKNEDGMGVWSAADDLLAALPEILRAMVKPLVWDNAGGGDYWKSGEYGVMFSETASSETCWMTFIEGRWICQSVKSVAFDIANDHHRAQVLGALGF